MPRFLVPLALAACAALGLRSVVIEPFRIPTDSMLPTLRPGDRLFVNKLLYGAPLPFTSWRLPALRTPQRVDVVVFRAEPDDERHEIFPSPWQVKRIVALTGDRVRVRDGALWINGAPCPAGPRARCGSTAAARRSPARARACSAASTRWRTTPAAWPRPSRASCRRAPTSCSATTATTRATAGPAYGSYSQPSSVQVHGELNSTPNTFSTYADFTGRTRAVNHIHYDNETWSMHQYYDTPDLSDIVQEIIDLPNWVSGNNMVMFVGSPDGAAVTGLGACSYEYHRTEPRLSITYESTSVQYGRTETCEPEVYVANKHNRAQITDIYCYDASLGSYSTNLYNTYPFYLFNHHTGLDPAVDDSTYFGINTSADESGPLSSLIFDIITVQNGITAEWEYYDSGTVRL